MEKFRIEIRGTNDKGIEEMILKGKADEMLAALITAIREIILDIENSEFKEHILKILKEEIEEAQNDN